MSAKTYELVTQTIINHLESGEIPWQKPWQGKNGYPKNISSLKTYSGINFWNTALTAMDRGYSSAIWGTYKQISDVGGQVKRGEKGTPILFFKMLEKENKKGDKDEIPFASHSSVFNLDQCENVDTIRAIENRGVKVREFTPIESAEQIAAKYLTIANTMTLEHKGVRAFYDPIFDGVTMPPKENFNGNEEYYSTLFHEFSHSTGHEKRLNRLDLQKIAGFGSHEYSKEELVAELSSAYLCAESGISMPVIKNQAAYIQGWLKQLKNDRSMLVSAASKAMKASDFILGKVGA